MNFFKRIINRLIVNPAKISNQQSDFLECDPTSILLNHTHFDFRTNKDKRTYITLGEKCIIGAKFIFETNTGIITIGNNVQIGNATLICRSEIKIGNDVTMAWGITIYDHDSHSIYWEQRSNDNSQCYEDYLAFNGNNIVRKDWKNVQTSPIIISDKVWIGFNVIILKGVTIGEGAVIGAGSVVTKNVDPFTLVAGNPAVFRKHLANH
jgi:galactoside O-acetyltransferase